MLTGSLVEKKSLRYTPAGVPVTEAVLAHQSEQMEAGAARQVTFELALVALGPSAQWLQGASPGSAVKVTGFLAAKSRNSKTPVLHVTSIEFLEGN
ncbi:MAG TPA: primosomal replication protein N [Rhodocyclaceae bacterium]|nr:primosomal replication protein N [Rhodocyclaceae bacterium]